MSYDLPECGPFGITLSQELGRMQNSNVSFSEQAWQAARQEGCIACPGRTLPSWPPPNSQFLYPTLQKEKQTVLGATQYDPDLKKCPEAAPWQTSATTKNSLTCAMTRANNLLNADPGYDAQKSFDHTNRMDDTDMAAEVARSILRGSIPVHSNGANGANGSNSGNLINGANGANGSTGGNQINYSFGQQNGVGEQYFGDTRATATEMATTRPDPDPDPDPDGGVLSTEEYSIRNLLPCIANTWTGIAYDMARYDQLPVDSNEGHAKKIEYVFVRDERWKYVVTTGLLVLFVTLLIAAIISTSMGMGSSPSTGLKMNGKVFDLSNLGIDNLEDMQIIIRPK
jgi:hypothetical protein